MEVTTQVCDRCRSELGEPPFSEVLSRTETFVVLSTDVDLCGPCRQGVGVLLERYLKGDTVVATSLSNVISFLLTPEPAVRVEEAWAGVRVPREPVPPGEA